ncbi:MAG: hypothetical protein RE468_11930 [Acidithiobacillus caldus]|uniref:hypothetical protein n=1 Tax=Acidithiobacillus caldus TaxID=33059 RepID=UPI00281666B1|nr:hypothetical protein [Acidithiobacillus caldus]WMT46587.1 MAG: hypothetical protein RE468_11930 [Acidithiobacillus caldus]
MSIFDQLENAQAQATQNQEAEKARKMLWGWLEVKRRFARIVGINAAYFGIPMLFGVSSFLATTFCLSVLILLNNLAPNPETARDLDAIGWQIRLTGWTEKWWVGALVAWFFGIGAWAHLIEHGPQFGPAQTQGVILIALSALGWFMLKFGPRTNGLISLMKDLGGHYVRTLW